MGCGVDGLGSLVWGLGFGVKGLGIRVWGLEFGVRSLGFGVWGLEFEVWGSGFRVPSFGVRDQDLIAMAPTSSSTRREKSTTIASIRSIRATFTECSTALGWR